MADGWSPPSDPPNASLPPWKVALSTKESRNSLKSRGFVKPNLAVSFLPHYNEAEKSLDEYFCHLENGILVSSIVGEPSPGLCDYLKALKEYFNEFGLRIREDQRLKLLKVLFLGLTKEGQHGFVIMEMAKVLLQLIGDSEMISPDEFTNWKAVCVLYKRYKLDEAIGRNFGVTMLIKKLKQFYPMQETENIWNYIRQTEKENFHEMCNFFLPVKGTVEEHTRYGAIHWWSDLWAEYLTTEDNVHLIRLFTDLTRHAPKFIDWRQYHKDISQRILAKIGLFTGKRLSDEDLSMFPDGIQTRWHLHEYGQWVACLLGGATSFQSELERILKNFTVFLSPQYRDEECSESLFNFMECVTSAMEERLDNERAKNFHGTPTNSSLKEQDIVTFVTAMLEPTTKALTSDKHRYYFRSILSDLASIRSQDIANFLVRSIYEALDDWREFPEDYLDTLLMSLSLSLPSFIENGEHNSGIDRQKIISLMDVLVTAIDFNDLRKTTLAMRGIVFCLNFKVSDNVVTTDTMDEARTVLARQHLDIADRIMDKILNLLRSWDQKNELLHTRQISALKEHIIASFKGLLTNSSKATVDKLTEKLLSFLDIADFESTLIAKVASGMVENVVRLNPSSFPKISATVLSRTRPVLKDGKKCIENYASVASNLCFMKSASVLKYKKVIYEVVALLLDSDCKAVYESGVKALTEVLLKLGRRYVSERTLTRSQVHSENFSNSSQNREVIWHIPLGEHQEMAKDLLNYFVFPSVERLRDETLTGECIQKHLRIVSTWEAACFFFPPPPVDENSCNTEEFSVVPPVKYLYPDTGETSFARFRENLIMICEEIIPRLLKEKNPNGTLFEVVELLAAVLDQTGNRKSTTEFMEFDPLSDGISIDGDVFDLWNISQMELKGIAHDKKPLCKKFEQRICKILWELVNVGLKMSYECLINAGLEHAPHRVLMKHYKTEINIWMSQESAIPELKLEVIRENHGELKKEKDPYLCHKKVEKLQGDIPGLEEYKRLCLDDASRYTFFAKTSGALEELCLEMWKEKQKTGPWLKFSDSENLLEAKRITEEFRSGEMDFYNRAKVMQSEESLPCSTSSSTSCSESTRNESSTETSVST